VHDVETHRVSRILLVDGTNIVMRYAHAMASQSVAEPDNPAFSADTQRVASACVKAIRDVRKGCALRLRRGLVRQPRLMA
jgi:hypothetical protein